MTWNSKALIYLFAQTLVKELMETQTDNQPNPVADANEEQANLLSDVEARVLGCLMEKQQTTPDQYPLTLNSLVLACNQKSSREPRMSLTEGEVGHCLRELENRELVRVDMGARAYRYEHRMTTKYHVDKAQQAVLMIMMLRGPQTSSELFTRTQRTGLFSDVEDINNALERLSERAKPLIKLIPRQSGQREDRHAHLLCGEPAIPVIQAPTGSISKNVTTALEARVEELESQVAEMKEQISEANKTIGRLLESLGEG